MVHVPAVVKVTTPSLAIEHTVVEEGAMVSVTGSPDVLLATGV
ncbi:hypothetical protein [Ferrimicrobium sp.]|nr:hypothetical protein [Ferrimicrobium sp.]